MPSFVTVPRPGHDAVLLGLIDDPMTHQYSTCTGTLCSMKTRFGSMTFDILFGAMAVAAVGDDADI